MSMTGWGRDWPKARRRRIAHVLRKVTGADEEDVDALDGEQRIETVDRLQRLDQATTRARSNCG